MNVAMILIVCAFICYGPLPTCFFRRKPRVDKLILTFDDGPDPQVTPKVEKVLQHYQYKGIFFFCGDRLRENRALVRRIACHHQVGIHGWDHSDAWLLDPVRAVKGWRKTLAAMEELGLKPTYYRGPYGRFNLVDVYYMRKHHLPALFWDGIHRDWTCLPSGALAQRLWRKHRRGGVVLLHDGSRGRAVPGANEAMVEELDAFLHRRRVEA